MIEPPRGDPEASVSESPPETAGNVLGVAGVVCVAKRSNHNG